MIRRVALVLPFVLPALAGCGPLAGGSTVTSAADQAFPPKPADCPIDVYAGQPPGAFARAGQLTARLHGPGAATATLDQVLPELKRQACAAGADAIAFVSERRAAEPDGGVYLVSAQAIRFEARR